MSQREALRSFAARTVEPLARRFPLVDLFFEDVTQLTCTSEKDGREPLSFGRITGASLRALSDTSRFGAASTDVSATAIGTMLQAAGGRKRGAPGLPLEVRTTTPERGTLAPWVDAVQQLRALAEKRLPAGVRVACSLEWTLGTRGIVGGGGAPKAWRQSYAVLSVRITMESGESFVRDLAYSADGSPPTQKEVMALSEAAVLAQRMVARATRPSHGSVPVIVAPGAGAVLFHEIVGHPLEADFILKDLSPFAALSLGDRVSIPALSIADEPGTKLGPWGMDVDDDGVRARRSPLILVGHVVGMLHDRVSAYRLGRRPTGNARRARFDLDPEPRMRTLVVANGTEDPDGMLSGIRDGIYVTRFGNGISDMARGTFSLEVEEGRRIRRGRLGETVSGFHLRGEALAALDAVEAVGRDGETLKEPVPCMKGGLVPTGVVGPTVRFRALEVA